VRADVVLSRSERYQIAEKVPCWRCGITVAALTGACKACRFQANRPIKESPDCDGLSELAGKFVPDGKGILRWTGAKPIDLPDPRRGPLPSSCGRDSGYSRHVRAGEDACPECRDARSVAERGRYARRKARQDGAA